MDGGLFEGTYWNMGAYSRTYGIPEEPLLENLIDVFFVVFSVLRPKYVRNSLIAQERED